MISEIFTSAFYTAFSISILLCYRVGKILNLSFASFFTLGAYLSILNPLLAIPFGASAGFILHKLTKKLSIANATIFSLGFAIAIEEILRIYFRTEYIILPVQKITLFGEMVVGSHAISGLISTAFVTIFLCFLLSKKSINLRVMEEDLELAEIYGVRTERLRLIVLTITGTLIAFLGSLHNPGIVYPTLGWQYLIFSVIIATLANIFERAYLFAILFAFVITCLPKFF
ncbi:MAG: hypothetical protein RMH75_04290 [Archaeoglobaceae archaeon]|nr:hypothetical protein [Archaeoglobaceae archaeon]MDW7989869.1 hypothetical protein [Archaeoglobaceae archaeon]